MELMIINIASGIFLMVSLYQIYMYHGTMENGALHHLLSHFYIALFAVIAINAYVHKGCVTGIVILILYVLQHISKENIRLIKTGRWTPTVKEDCDV